MAPHYLLVVPPGEERVLQCRLVAEGDVVTEPFAERNFGAVIQKRLKEANEFYHVAIPCKLKHFIFNLNGIFFRGIQREYSSKPLKHSIVERILVFKR